MPRKPPRSTEERLVRAQKSMMPGTLGGRVASASPMSLDVTRLDPRLRAQPPAPTAGGGKPQIKNYYRGGPISTDFGGDIPLRNDSDATFTVTSVRAELGTAPTSQDVIIDVTINGTSIFSAAQPTVGVGHLRGFPEVPDAAADLTAGDVLFVDVLQGDTDAADLHVTIVLV